MKISKSNNGFSLVEMIVTILITAFIMLGIMMFISTSRVTYTKVNTSAKLQEEALAAEKFMNEILMEADYISLPLAAPEPVNPTLVPGTSFTGTIEYWIIRSRDNAEGDVLNTKRNIYVLVFEKPTGRETGQLRYAKVTDSDDLDNFQVETNSVTLTDDNKEKYIYDSLGDKYKLVSDCVEAVSIGRVPFSNLVNTSIQFKYNGVTYTSSNSVLSRNYK